MYAYINLYVHDEIDVQFGEMRYNNEGAYAELKPPNFECPCFHSFKAVERPKVEMGY